VHRDSDHSIGLFTIAIQPNVVCNVFGTETTRLDLERPNRLSRLQVD